MIRLSLPAFDPKRPLAIRAAGRFQNLGGLEFQVYVVIRFWAGGFAGNVVRDLMLTGPAGEGMLPCDGDLFIPSPDAIGLTGTEGWFAIEPSLLVSGYIYVHDVNVTYTPPGADATKAKGHFS